MQAQTHFTRRYVVTSIAIAMSIPPSLLVQALPLHAQASGRFVGNLSFDTEVRDEVYRFKLRENYGYLDSQGIMWQAKAGLLTDGASIPRIFWPIVGHPYEGLYLDAAVIHDFYCMEKNRYRKWQDVHHVFHEAMLTKGVGPTKAKLMFFAVWRFGPRWEISELINCTRDPANGEYCDSATPSSYKVTSSEVLGFDAEVEKEVLRKVDAQIQKDNPTLEQLTEAEAGLPSLQRGERGFEVQADTARGRYFQNPNRIPLVEPQ
ncbi:protein of unknown function DUF1353 [Rhizobium leguminosarum bv. trifolii WSM2304]|uniref:DUF1353 domain-containing protein n=1 Tax=Rhizobium leguminosarum bv. trifolii (strain WSM2304) TaxID=395492 RepID=A0ABF7QSE9_RHILW|nr:DUF1353 domain-containing protein [Rhizobium leguminosarum]ACI56869.1 protein of unknown function DUF1353 [Rhizobium leguminosarum bv. trifolii WSM2304]